MTTATIGRERELRTATIIARWVGVVYYVAGFIIFRDVVASIPSVLAGQSVIVGDELVPFFNPTSQLFDQAKGDFSELTNGYEFRVRYAFLTTWLRHYQVLPFAIVLVIPGLFTIAYRVTAKFIIDVFRTLSPVAVALATAFPVALIYLIVTYAKITHFYTLGLGLVLMTISVLYLLRALLFTEVHWVRHVLIACLATLLNPAVHYLVLFSVFFGLAGVVLALGELARWIRRGGPASVAALPKRTLALLRSGEPLRRLRGVAHRWGKTTLGRGLGAAVLFALTTLIPYALFVQFVALRGVENLSETVPGDYYFIRDASVSWLHVLSWDLAGIMDKVFYGDYLAKVPRYPNLVYSLLFFAPLLVPWIRRALVVSRPHRQLFGVIYVVSLFSIWATIGYAEPQWFPSFHRSLAAVTRTLYSTGTPLGSLALDLSSAVVQVLRFPHRFQLILFTLAPLTLSLSLAWGIDALQGRWLRRRDRAGVAASGPNKDSVWLRAAAVVMIATVFFVPFWTNANYRQVVASGDFGTFLAPYPTNDLASLKKKILSLPEGKTVVLPPTETAKLVADDNGVDHKLIDKFFIYYLDQPSFYYGLTGDSGNKFEFFLILRGLYYQQDWWINPARDIGLRYLVVNKQIHSNGGVGAEYLPNVESYIGPAMERQVKLGLVNRLYENDTYVLYEIPDKPAATRKTLLVDSSWSSYLKLVWNRLELTRCYNLEYLPTYSGDAASADTLIYSDRPATTALDVWAVDHRDAFFAPTPKTFPFDSNVVASSYYLSPMFREFLLLSNTKWNRTSVITPGVFGTLEGSFVALPRATKLALPVAVADKGKYRVLIRGAFAGNAATVTSRTLGLDRRLELRSAPDDLQFFTKDSVYTANRVPVDTTTMSRAELETATAAGDLVPVNVNYEYHDLGVVEAAAGKHTVSLAKSDGNPMLLEGVLLIPEEQYQAITHQTKPNVVGPNTALDCGTTYPVFGPNTEGYVDPAANGPHADLSNEELLDLAAAGVPSLVPDESGGLGADWLVLILAGALLGSAVLTVVSRTRVRPDEQPNDLSAKGADDDLQPKEPGDRDV